MPKSFHVCQSVRGAVERWNGRDWQSATSWITRADGSSFCSGEELELRFHEMLAEGVEKIPFGDCDNHDPKHGCMGHESVLPTHTG